MDKRRLGILGSTTMGRFISGRIQGSSKPVSATSVHHLCAGTLPSSVRSTVIARADASGAESSGIESLPKDLGVYALEPGSNVMSPEVVVGAWGIDMASILGTDPEGPDNPTEDDWIAKRSMPGMPYV